MGFEMCLPPLQPRTRLAHAAAKWAAANGRFEVFNNALFKAFFQDGLDIGKLEVLLRVGAELGLDPKGFETEPRISSYTKQVLEDEEPARLANVRAIPAYVSHARVLAAGVQSLDGLQQILLKS